MSIRRNEVVIEIGGRDLLFHTAKLKDHVHRGSETPLHSGKNMLYTPEWTATLHRLVSNSKLKELINYKKVLT